MQDFHYALLNDYNIVNIITELNLKIKGKTEFYTNFIYNHAHPLCFIDFLPIPHLIFQEKKSVCVYPLAIAEADDNNLPINPSDRNCLRYNGIP